MLAVLVHAAGCVGVSEGLSVYLRGLLKVLAVLVRNAAVSEYLRAEVLKGLCLC